MDSTFLFGGKISYKYWQYSGKKIDSTYSRITIFSSIFLKNHAKTTLLGS